MINKQQRNKLKNSIVDELTNENTGIFNKQEGYAIYSGTDLEMVIGCVFKGLNKYTDKDLTFKETMLDGAEDVLSDKNAFKGDKEISGKKL
jgi:hypothetical protein